jgi:hypothetical protein
VFPVIEQVNNAENELIVIAVPPVSVLFIVLPLTDSCVMEVRDMEVCALVKVLVIIFTSCPSSTLSA